jgi:ribonuclease P protein component
MPAPTLGLPRARRIQCGRDFARARAQGRRLAHGSVILNWLPLPPGAVSRLGVIVNRKVGNAVARSRARRLLRESFRRRQPALAHPADVVLVARPSLGGRSFAEVDADVAASLRRAGLVRDPGPR